MTQVFHQCFAGYPAWVTVVQPYPGDRLGLPEAGRGSIGTFPRRLAGVVIDWVLCLLIANAALGLGFGEASGAASFAPLAVFAVENLLLVSTLGTTIGHRIVGLQVLRVYAEPVRAPDGPTLVAGVPGFARGGIRTVLLCLAIPALIWDADGRGMHDRWARTVIVRSR
ncbi:RDD family protein [Ornithinicoccus hortensis]|uniref:RDD family protein n=1 Tax=Ornithinicoccus hortensis TaxID=82346 RepID=A0A542YR51_9MICO|nr:RDD family protein [Ornithinicoccus hortensis]